MISWVLMSPSLISTKDLPFVMLAVPKHVSQEKKLQKSSPICELIYRVLSTASQRMCLSIAHGTAVEPMRREGAHS